MLELSLTSKMGWASHIVSIAKVAGNIQSLKFVTNLEPPWNTTAMPGSTKDYLHIMDELQKRACQAVGLALVAAHELLAY